jgi:hypothetical protein
VAEDAEAAGEERLPSPIALGVLDAEEADEGLGGGKAHGGILSVTSSKFKVSG